ncbi:hypothetical protein MKK65_17005 [Methylobacterium sp. J-001]|uniref:hypothetical protein n=1 Tax=Methylobacterium sp. J-001 TaxID=2836609 RepID=UPI001FB885B6|nr:hypothetical protein [Methylobacterium sp. J-001]MCJ2118246.1 hypothetical protein [Methylobacterium sp. J-001]
MLGAARDPEKADFASDRQGPEGIERFDRPIQRDINDIAGIPNVPVTGIAEWEG